jgi:hypothetical protein
VSELITASGGWNEALIKHVFVRVDANAILSTPIRGTGMTDGLGSWRNTEYILCDQPIDSYIMANGNREIQIWRRLQKTEPGHAFGSCVYHQRSRSFDGAS